MVGEIPGNSEETHDQLKNILNGVVDEAKRKLHNLIGPLEESGISREQFEELQKELQDVDDPTERVKRVYRFYQEKSPREDLPEEFNDFLKGK